MLVSEAVAEILTEEGVRDFFGLIGSGNFAITNGLAGRGARFVASRHEGGAVTMADAYARVSRQLGVCTVHQGPGLTNTLTGLTEAAKSRTPLLVLAADTAAAAIRSNFRIDQDRLVASVGAVAERLHGPETAIADTVRAVRRARVERRPVVLMMPLDIQAQEAPPGNHDPIAGRLPPPVRPARESVTEVVDLLEGSERPLVIAGRGAVLAAAREPLERLGELSGALLATSAVAHGLFSRNPWSLGISGGFATPLAAELISQADLVLAFGASLNMWTTRHGNLVGREAKVVQVDHEAEAIGADHRVDVGVVGDAGETALDLVGELGRKGPGRSGWRSVEIAGRIREGHWRDQPYADAGDSERIDPRTLSIALDSMLPEERTVAIDSGHFMGYPAMYLQVPDAGGFVFTQAFQSIGLGLATGIGAAIARPDRLTVAALGDGGALMALPELETVARLGLDMLIVVYNDAAYAAEVHHFGPMGLSTRLVEFPDTDFAALARAAGMDGVTVTRREDLASVEAWVGLPGRGPMLVDAKVVKTVVAEWLEEAFRGH